ncbi:HD domain-containing protein [Photorhabdus temperata]|nr:HD domain-containing protein [Photorhabdus temperata]MCT8349353.1 HD domain-containing protein [Photorhabdus temperata]
MKHLNRYEMLFREFVSKEMNTDPAHDISHIIRVVQTSKRLCLQEKADSEVVIPAAYLHDCYTLPKNHLDRRKSSQIAADMAITFLEKIAYPQKYLSSIHHAIVAHSFSADIVPTTLEAKIVRDADRLDALGAIGIARCIQVGMTFNSQLYSEIDPFCVDRVPDDKMYIVDHFYTKLFRLPETMLTTAGKNEASKRVSYMSGYLAQLNSEIK